MEKKWNIVCFMRIECDPSDEEPMTREEAYAEIENLRLMQPEHIFTMEECEVGGGVQ